MNTKFNGITVETSGIRTISGGGTNASTASGALANLGGYPASNPSGFIAGTSDLVYVTGDQVISGLKTFSQGISIEGDSSLSALFVSGQRIGVNNENPQASLDISGSTMFSERPTVNSTGVLLSGDINTSNFYTNNNPSGFITGVSQFNYISGDLTGSLLSPTLSHIQGNPISAASPSGGQTLQWNGTAWVPGSIPNGGNGGGGLVYYFNFANTSGIAPTGGLPINGYSPSQLGRNYSVGSGSVEATNLSQTGYRLICGFVTVSGEPGVTDIPAGLWDFNIWADVVGNNGSANQTQFQLRTYKYNSTSGTYTSLANSDDVYIYDPATTAQYIANVTMPQTTILETDRLYIEMWAKKNVSQSRDVRFYFDSLHPSHVHTTLPSVAGNGVVKVINGVMQSPASKIVNNDVSENAAIAISKVSQSTSKILGRTTAGTGAVEELNVAGNLALSAGTLTSTSTDVQIFTSSGRWTKPAGAKSVNIQLFGGGGGGGGGRKNTQSGAQKGGGGGGGGGSYLNITLPASVLGNTEFITIGAGGTGGTGTATNGNGGVGETGGNTVFQSLICAGGNGGGFGSDSGGAGGLGILQANNGGNGGSSTPGGGGLPTSATTFTQYGGAGGGGGGSVSATPAVFFAGGTGGRSNVLNLIGGASGPIGVSGGAGINNASATTGLFAAGSGGGGGGAGIIVSGGNGGAGGFPAGGGGGGGATETGTTSGAGGVGGNGLAIITTYF